MTVTSPSVAAPAEPRPSWWHPFGDHSRPRRLAKVLAWLLGIAVALAVLDLLGVDVLGWFSDLWDALSSIGLGYLLAGWTLQTGQTTLTAFAWYSILHAAYPRGRVTYLQILAAYAAGVAMNGFLPANIGTVAMVLMYVAIIPGANLPGVLGGMVVQKIFFTVAGTFVYVYLFASVPGSFDLQLPTLSDHPALALGLAVGAAILLLILGRIFWRKLQGLWAKAVQGGAILARRRDYALKVALPSFGAWLAKLGVIAVFLTGYGITVTFHSVMSVMGGNSIANTVSVTPGGVGVNQADQRRGAQRRDRRGHGDRLLARPATRDHGLEHRVRGRARHLGLRLDRGKAARRAVLHRREGQGLRAESAARGEARRPPLNLSARRRRRPASGR